MTATSPWICTAASAVDGWAKPIVVNRTPIDFSRLDVVIEETRKDLEAMERTRDILERGR